ncbi:tRNA pseudouridine synthase C [compost metagenome]
MNKLFAEKHPRKVYWAVVEKAPKEKSGSLLHHLERNEKQNKTYAYNEARKNSKEARLKYRQLISSDNYTLLEVELETGRHHQIRAQLSAMGCIIKGDLKYGAKRSNPDGSIYLHSRELEFEHPTSKENIKITAPVPNDNLWLWFEKEMRKK